MPIQLTPEQLARVRKETAEARAALAHKPGIEELFSDEEWEADEDQYRQMLRCVARLKQAREVAGWDVAEVARRAGVGAGELQQLESGSLPNPDWRLLGRYAVAVGLRLELTVAPKPVEAASAP